MTDCFCVHFWPAVDVLNVQKAQWVWCAELQMCNPLKIERHRERERMHPPSLKLHIPPDLNICDLHGDVLHRNTDIVTLLSYSLYGRFLLSVSWARIFVGLPHRDTALVSSIQTRVNETSGKYFRILRLKNLIMMTGQSWFYIPILSSSVIVHKISFVCFLKCIFILVTTCRQREQYHSCLCFAIH